MNPDHLTDEDLAALEAELAELSEDNKDSTPKETSDELPHLKVTVLETPEKPKPKVQLKSYVDPSQLKSDLTFSENNLTDAFISQAPLFADYARRAAQAAYQEDKHKQARDILEAKIDREIRDQQAELGQKVTEAMIGKMIRLDPRYQKAQNRRNEAKMIAELCKSAAESFRQRRDLLLQCGADAREERKGEMRMRVAEVEETASKNKIDRLKQTALNR